NAPHAQIAPQVTADPAADLVHNFRLGSNLESMANSVAASTHTNGTILPGSATFEIHKLLPKYQPQWDANLAKAYSNHLAAQELRSLAKDGPSSPYADKLKQVQPLVAADMRQMSEGLLKQLVTEALVNASR